MYYTITIIIPALNEEQSLDGSVENVLSAFHSCSVRGELIIVDDGSGDRTGALAEAWASRHDFIRVLHHDRPQGIGAAFWDGVQHARGEVVAMLPGDGENDAAEILCYLPLMAKVDIVVPFAFNPKVRPWRRRFLSFLYHEIVYITFSLALNYLNGTVMYRRSILRDITLKSTGFFYQTELLIKTIIGHNYLYAEVPYALRKRRGGRSKATTLWSFLRVAGSYLRTIQDVNPLKRTYAPVTPDSITARRLRELADSVAGLEQ
jgi:glycosyltransferase involved in cell wall biosynthesis